MSDATLLALDLEHLGLQGALCAYVLLGDEPLLVDPGPSTTLGTLERKLAEHGVALTELRHVLLTHVHLDHAGSTGHLLRRAPRLSVHVHLEGAPHMAEPEKLVASTRRTFGEAHDRLWGEVLPVPADRIRAWEPGVRGPFRGVRAFPTPGHIGHHLSYLDESGGTLFSGDSMGIVLSEASPSHLPTPPPAVDLEAWRRTLESLAPLRPERIGVTHFGLHGGFEERRLELAERIDELEARVARALDTGDEGAAEAYEEEVREVQSRHLPRERVDRYFGTFPASMDWAGARRYVEKQRRGEGGKP